MIGGKLYTCINTANIGRDCRNLALDTSSFMNVNVPFMQSIHQLFANMFKDVLCLELTLLNLEA